MKDLLKPLVRIADKLLGKVIIKKEEERKPLKKLYSLAYMITPE